jgi:hypothetical protein
MPRQRRITKAILDTIAHGEDRSPLFWWMVENHDEIIASARGRRMQWRTFCAEISRHGLTDTRGGPPTERGAREVWMQARRAVAQARQREQHSPSPQRKFPSRISPDWRPTIVSPAASSARVAGYSTTLSVPTAQLLTLTIDDLPTVDPSGAPLEDGHVFYRNKSVPRRAAEQLLKLDQQAKQIDRHK